LIETLEQSQAKALHYLLKTQGHVQDRQNPLIELVICSLAYPEGGLVYRPTSDLDSVNWDRFLHEEFEDPEGVCQSLHQIMSDEDMPVPEEPAKIQEWAEDLIMLFLEARGIWCPSR
jgi:hypothetical protein